MDRRDTVRWLWTFHDWARPRLTTAASKLSPDQLQAPGVIAGGLGSGSLHDMLAHVVGAEEIWLRRWNGEEKATLSSGKDFAGLDAIVGRWQEVERDRSAVFASVSDDELEIGRAHV